MINKDIFKSYDVRGIYPTELNEQAAYQIGRAFVRHTGVKNVVVGYDARISSHGLFEGLAAGLLAEGAQVTTIGQLPTECVYFAIGNYDFDGAIMITASHNPKEYNGLKMMKKVGKDIIWIRGKDLASEVQEDDATIGSVNVSQKDIWEDYIKHILSFSGEMKPLHVVVDASNGVIGQVIERIKSKLPIKVASLNFEPNGNFPNHPPNPLEKNASDQVKDAVKKNHADVGFIFDADADRIFLIDEQGVMLPADLVLLLLAKQLLQKSPGAAIIYNAICSKAVPEFVKKWGGTPVRTAVGFVNVREGLIKNNGIMGGELSAHYCFRDHFYTDSGIIAFLTLLQIISAENKPVSQLVKDLSLYFKSAELNFTVTDKAIILEKVKGKYTDGQQDFLDGITVEYDDWWFNVRPSNTEPLLRLTIEANTKELLEEKKKELSDFIQA